MGELRGIPMEDGDDIVIPIYIFENSALIASGEGLISKIGGRYFGSFDFETSKSSYLKEARQVGYPMNLVHGAKGQRTSIGEITFTNMGDEFSGSIEFRNDPDLDILMRTARSLVNLDW